MHGPFLPIVKIFPLNLSTPFLEFSGSKHTSSQFFQGVKTHTKTPLPKQYFTNKVAEQPKNFCGTCPSKKLKPRSLQCQFRALLMRHSVYRQANTSII